MLSEATGFSECSFDSMSQPAVVALYSDRIFFPDDMIFFLESGHKTLPVIRTNL
jgi:hypothetical protein